MTSRLAICAAVLALAGLVACGPTRPVAPEAAVGAAVASAAGAVDQPATVTPTAQTSAKAPERRGLFGRMLRRDTAAVAPDASPIADVSPEVVDAASEEALAQLADEAETPAETEVVAAEEPQRKRLWPFGKRRDAADEPVAAEEKPEDTTEVAGATEAETAVGEPDEGTAELAAQESAAPDAKPEQKRRLGLFQRRDKTTAQPEPQVAEAEVVVEPAPEASKETEVASAPEAPKKERRGLFARRATADDDGPEETAEPVVLAAAVATEPDAKPARASKRALREASVPEGVTLPFGEVGMACGVAKRKMGKEIDKSGGYRLFDTNPGGIGPRTFFLTGLKDGCARQFTGAVALFGSLEVYEVLHFAGGGGRATGATDAAYRKLRSSSCPAPRRGPCDARGMKKLSKSTAFVSVYAAKGRSTHLELLLNNGKLVAEARK